MAFLAHISMKSETNALKVSIIQKADPVKKKVYFCYYRLAKGISGILSYAKEGVRLWFRTKRPAYRQLCLKLTAYRSIPEYPVTFYDINHFFMYAAYFIRVYSGEKVADCINFWNPSTDTVFQSFRHAFRGWKNGMETFILQHQKKQYRHDNVKQWNRFSFSFVR